MLTTLRTLCLIVLISLLGACQKGPSFSGLDISGANYGKDFSLKDTEGQTRRLADFRGRVVVLFFGYTQCPDVCPTNLSTLAQVMKQLGDDSNKVQVLFMTVDPERDTPELLRQYVPSFDPRFLGLYSDAQGTATVASEFKVFYKKNPGTSPDSYTVDHTAGTYIFDPQGRLRLYEKHGETPERLSADIRMLLQVGK